MKKMAIKKMAGGSAKPMMKSGGKKMAAGGTTKKKYAMAGTVSASEQCKPGNPKCKQKKSFGQMRAGAPKAIKTWKGFN